MISRKDFGLAVRAYRFRNNISQVALGEKIGLSKNSISRIELGDPTVRPRTRAMLVKYLNMLDAELAELARSAAETGGPGEDRGSDVPITRDEFADAIRDYRHRESLSQTELGKRIGVSESTVSRLECGGQMVRPATKSKIIRYFRLFHPDMEGIARSLELDLHSETPRAFRRLDIPPDVNGEAADVTNPADPVNRDAEGVKEVDEVEEVKEVKEVREFNDNDPDKWRAICRLLERFDDRRVDTRTIEQLGESLSFALWKRSGASDKP